MMADDEGRRLSLIIGGPFHGFLQRLRLLGPDRLPGFRAAAILAGIMSSSSDEKPAGTWSAEHGHYH